MVRSDLPEEASKCSAKEEHGREDPARNRAAHRRHRKGKLAHEEDAEVDKKRGIRPTIRELKRQGPKESVDDLFGRRAEEAERVGSIELVSATMSV